LTDPARYGADPSVAFHVVAPSLPGYGFSGPTTERGWHGHRAAASSAELMRRLGYERFFAQGGDWGSMVTMSVAGQFPERVAGVHVNLLAVPPPDDPDAFAQLDDGDQAKLAAMGDFLQKGTGYQAIQSTKPQTLAYGLTDSPAGLAGWILEKFQAWSDCGGDVARSFTKDQLLDDISLYWLTGTINSSMRLYYETIGPFAQPQEHPVTVPVGHAAFPAEIYRSPRRWVEAAFDVVHWVDMPRGGHFAAMEEPELLVADIRTCFGAMAL
jgi:microsomal epoxide hydrolase